METSILYVSGTGDDGNDGLSKESPFLTLARAWACRKDRLKILLEGGYTYNGNVTMAEGLEGFSLGAYGAGIPLIKAGLHFRQCRNIWVYGLSILGEGYHTTNGSIGILAEACASIRIICVEAQGFHLAGIRLAGCVDSEITGCYVHDNGAVGIDTCAWEDNGFYCRNIRIAYSKAYDNAGDHSHLYNHSGSGIVIAYTEGAIVEFCEAAGNGWAQRQFRHNGPVGIWCCCGATDIVFRYNISHHNRTQPGAVDGDGMDMDGEVSGIVMEYNYTYENEGSGYLMCEFSGIITRTPWQDNTLRYSVSIRDNTTVPNYGAILLYSPEGVPFRRFRAHHNLLSPPRGMSAVILKEIAPGAEEIGFDHNFFVTSGPPAANGESDLVSFHENAVFHDPDIHGALLACAPRLTEPRSLLHQPVFQRLKDSPLAAAFDKAGINDLFTVPDVPMRRRMRWASAETDRPLLHWRLYGPDYVGSERVGDVSLHYDSLRLGVVTRLRGEDANIQTPLPLWHRNKLYMIEVETRLTSPDVRAYLYLRRAGLESKVYLDGSVSGYSLNELPFSTAEGWADDDDVILGIRFEGGSGYLYIHGLAVVEQQELQESEELLSLPVRSFGDCFWADGALILQDCGWFSRTVYNGGAERVILNYEAEREGTQFYMRVGDRFVCKTLMPGQHQVVLEFSEKNETIEVGVVQHDPHGGRLSVRSLRLA